MWSRRDILYLVEGETEKRLLKILKDGKNVYSGRIFVCNIVQERIRPAMFMSYGTKISIAAIFDTDTSTADLLKQNISILKDLPNFQEMVCIPQVSNFEDELCYACNIRDVRVITGSRSKSDFKRDFLNAGNILQKLNRKGFDVSKLWSREASGVFSFVINESYKIKRVAKCK